MVARTTELSPSKQTKSIPNLHTITTDISAPLSKPSVFDKYVPLSARAACNIIRPQSGYRFPVKINLSSTNSTIPINTNHTRQQILEKQKAELKINSKDQYKIEGPISQDRVEKMV